MDADVSRSQKRKGNLYDNLHTETDLSSRSGVDKGSPSRACPWSEQPHESMRGVPSGLARLNLKPPVVAEEPFQDDGGIQLHPIFNSCCPGDGISDKTLQGIQCEISQMHRKLRQIDRLVDEWAHRGDEDIDSEPDDWMHQYAHSCEHPA